MAIRERRIRGVAKGGKIELEFAVLIPDGTVVEVVMAGEPEVRRDAENGLLASLRDGFYLGGLPYLNRDEFYRESGRPK